MRLVETKCPTCGAEMSVDADKGQCFCTFCGSKLLIDDQKIHVVYDNAAQSGYEFEKGRQQAQAELSQKQYQARMDAQRHAEMQEHAQAESRGSVCPKCNGHHISNQRETTEKRGRHQTVALCNDCGYSWSKNEGGITWWKVLLWIFFLPVMLTILIVKSKKLQLWMKIALLVLIWGVTVFVWATSGSDSTKAPPETSSVVSDQIVEKQRLFDDLNLLTSDQKDNIENLLLSVSKNHEIDLVIVLTETLTDKTDREFAQELFENSNLGYGDDYSVFFLIIQEDGTCSTPLNCEEKITATTEDLENLVDHFTNNTNTVSLFDSITLFINEFDSIA